MVLDKQPDADLVGLLPVLPDWVQLEVLEHAHHLEEIVMDEGEALALRVGGAERYVYSETLVSRVDIAQVRSNVDGFKDNGRAGISGLLHRVSVKRDDLKRDIGLTIRYATHVYGVAEPLRPTLEADGSVLLIGAPGSGKTTLMRGIIAIKAEKNQKQTCVCDSAGELGGHGTVAHPCLGKARRFHVTQPSDQPFILTQIIQNHSPIDIILDEMGYAKDVAIAEKAARSGTNVIGSVHGRTIEDVLENPVLYPLLGYPDKRTKTRAARPVFKAAVEVVRKGVYVLYPDLAEVVDQLLLGERPEGTPLGLPVEVL